MSGISDHKSGSKAPPGETPAAESGLLPPEEQPTETDAGPATGQLNDTLEYSMGLASVETAGEEGTVVEGGPPAGMQWEADHNARAVLEQVKTAEQEFSALHQPNPLAPAPKVPTRQGMGDEAPPPLPPPGRVDPMADTLATLDPRLTEDAPPRPPDDQTRAQAPAPPPVAPEPPAPVVAAPRPRKSKQKEARRASRGPSNLLLAVLWVVALASVTVAVVLYVTR